MSDEFITALAGLTHRLYVYRVIYTIMRAEGMARLLEIKGLGADIASVKKGIGDLRSLATEVNTESDGLKAELSDLKDQIKEHRADLKFEAETLKNSSEDTDKKQDEKKT